MTYLELVNNILIRLRERDVTSVNDSAYSKLIGQFVNDAMQEIERSWDWSALRTTVSATTSTDIFNYELNGTGNDFEILNVINDTSNVFMEYRTAHEFDNWYLNQTPVSGSPSYYSWNGVSSDGDTQVDIYPKPDGVYSLRFNMIKRNAAMTSDTDTLAIPSHPVQMLAYAKAVDERGEDGGTSAQSAFATAQRVISDAIALDSARHPEELIFAAV
jgi:hypothetical protein